MVGGQHTAAPRSQRQKKAIAFDRQDQCDVVSLFARRLGRRTKKDPFPPPVGGTLICRRRLVPASAVTSLRVHDFELDFWIAEARQPLRRARTATAAIDHQVSIEARQRAVADLPSFDARHTRSITRRKQQRRDFGPFDEFDAGIFLDTVANDRLDQQATGEQHLMSGAAPRGPSFRIQSSEFEARIHVETTALPHRIVETGEQRAQFSTSAIEQAMWMTALRHALAMG